MTWTPYMKRKSSANYAKAVQHFKDIGEFKDGMILHHVDFTMIFFDPDRYIEWNPDDLIPLTKSQHVKLHNDFSRRSSLGLFDGVWNFRCRNLSWE